MRYSPVSGFQQDQRHEMVSTRKTPDRFSRACAPQREKSVAGEVLSRIRAPVFRLYFLQPVFWRLNFGYLSGPPVVEFTRKEKKIFGDISSLSKRLADDHLYEIVAEEISPGDLDPVAQLKALEKANGNEERARANYARHRIRRLKDMAAQYVIMEQVEAERQTEAYEASQRLEREDARRISFGGEIYSEHTRKHFTKADNGGNIVKYLVISTCIVMLLLALIAN